MAIGSLTSSVEGINLGRSLEVATFLVLGVSIVPEVVKVFVTTIFVVTTNIDDVLMIGITAHSMSTIVSFCQKMGSEGFTVDDLPVDSSGLRILHGRF